MASTSGFDWDPISHFSVFDDIIHTTFDENGEYHSIDDKPSFIGYTKNPPKKGKIWVDDAEFRKRHEMRNGIFEITAHYKPKGQSTQWRLMYTHRNMLVAWHKHGKLHREGDKPALRMIVGPTIKNLSVWYQNGIIDRSEDKPAFIAEVTDLEGIFSGTGIIKKWYKNGIIDRDYEPAIIISYGDSAPQTKIWIKQGELYRLPNSDGERMPVYEDYRIRDSTGEIYNIKRRVWKDHSEDLHNLEEHFANGCRTLYWIKDIKFKESWWNPNNIIFNIDYTFHRRSGPAWLSDTEKYYFIDGIELQQFSD